MANVFEKPQQAGFLEKLGTVLGGFGAGYQGRGTQFLQQQQAQRQQLSLERQKAAAEDMLKAKRLIEEGRLEDLRDLGFDRARMIEELGGDSSDTKRIIDLTNYAMLGDKNSLDMLNSEINDGLYMAQQQGLIKGAPVQEWQDVIENGRVVGQKSRVTGKYEPFTNTVKPYSNEAQIIADVNNGYLTPEEGEQALASMKTTQNIRERDIALKENVEERQQSKLSSYAEKVLGEAQDNFYTLQRQSNQMASLADEYEKTVKSSGVSASLGEFMKRALGSEDEVTLLRTKYNSIRASEAMKNLPPGAASDKDVELALSGFPTSTTNPEIISSFLRGWAKIAQYDAAYNLYKAYHIDNNRSIGGLTKGWRTSYEMDDGETVTNAEIATLAVQNRMSIDEVKKQLGVV